MPSDNNFNNNKDDENYIENALKQLEEKKELKRIKEKEIKKLKEQQQNETKNKLNETNNMTTAIADNLQKIRVNLANLRGMGEYMRTYANDSENIRTMGEDCEKSFKVLFHILNETKDIVARMNNINNAGVKKND
jgi:esterase/lipase